MYSKKTITIASTITASLIFLAVLFFILIPAAREINKLNDGISQEKNSLEKLYARGQNIKKTREEYEKIKDQMILLDNAFNHIGNELEFIQSLENTAEKYNLKQIIELEDPKQIKKEETDSSPNNYLILQVDLNLIGRFEDILFYLDEIQTQNHYLNINYIKLQNTKGESFVKNKDIDSNFIKEKNSPDINANIRGETYWAYYEPLQTN